MTLWLGWAAAPAFATHVSDYSLGSSARGRTVHEEGCLQGVCACSPVQSKEPSSRVPRKAFTCAERVMVAGLWFATALVQQGLGVPQTLSSAHAGKS